MNAVSPRCETTLRADALSDAGTALGKIDRFRSALVLKMHDTASYGPAIAGFAGVDKRTGLDVVRLPGSEQTHFLRHATRHKVFDLVIGAFELHHLDEVERRYVADEIGKLLTPGGAFLVADYTLPNLPDAAAFEPFVTSTNERVNIDSYGGIRPWYGAHAGWTAETIEELVAGAGLSHSASRSIPGHSALAVSSDDPSVATEIGRELDKYARYVTQRS
jgi:SAM-dependent methyltransferase